MATKILEPDDTNKYNYWDHHVDRHEFDGRRRGLRFNGGWGSLPSEDVLVAEIVEAAHLLSGSHEGSLEGVCDGCGKTREVWQCPDCGRWLCAANRCFSRHVDACDEEMNEKPGKMKVHGSCHEV